ncbi:MAG: hypothetical protein K1X75_08230 [Leptospirales bacterium]|nr:hypothetical protein [Leptospirales bacterium]
MLAAERAAWELHNEKNKANVRWLLLLLIGGYLLYLLRTNQAEEVGANRLFNGYFIAELIGGMSLVNALVGILLTRVRRGRMAMPAWLKYFTMIVDLSAVSIVLAPTGGSNSMFFVVYFVILVSNSLRYGMRLALLGLFVFNAMYFGILLYQYYPELHPPRFHAELLKISGVWIVGLYTGYVARRFSILQGEVHRYEQLTARLMVPRRGDEG